MNNHDHEPVTQPIRQEHPQAIRIDAIKQKIFETATKKVSAFDAETGAIEVSSEPAFSEPAPLSRKDEIARQMKNQKTNWLGTINEVTGRDK